MSCDCRTRRGESSIQTVGRLCQTLARMIRFIRIIGGSCLYIFPRNLAVVSVLYLSERPEITPHEEEPKRPKQQKEILNQPKEKR